MHGFAFGILGQQWLLNDLRVLWKTTCETEPGALASALACVVE